MNTPTLHYTISGGIYMYIALGYKLATDWGTDWAQTGHRLGYKLATD